LWSCDDNDGGPTNEDVFRSLNYNRLILEADDYEF
jgi:hypothetical protein